MRKRPVQMQLRAHHVDGSSTTIPLPFKGNLDESTRPLCIYKSPGSGFIDVRLANEDSSQSTQSEKGNLLARLHRLRHSNCLHLAVVDLAAVKVICGLSSLHDDILKFKGLEEDEQARQPFRILNDLQPEGFVIGLVQYTVEAEPIIDVQVASSPLSILEEIASEEEKIPGDVARVRETFGDCPVESEVLVSGSMTEINSQHPVRRASAGLHSSKIQPTSTPRDCGKPQDRVVETPALAERHRDAEKIDNTTAEAQGSMRTDVALSHEATASRSESCMMMMGEAQINPEPHFNRTSFLSLHLSLQGTDSAVSRSPPPPSERSGPDGAPISPAVSVTANPTKKDDDEPSLRPHEDIEPSMNEPEPTPMSPEIPGTATPFRRGKTITYSNSRTRRTPLKRELTVDPQEPTPAQSRAKRPRDKRSIHETPSVASAAKQPTGMEADETQWTFDGSPTPSLPISNDNGKAGRKLRAARQSLARATTSDPPCCVVSSTEIPFLDPYASFLRAQSVIVMDAPCLSPSATHPGPHPNTLIVPPPPLKRTYKFVIAVAAGFTIVTHDWVVDCERQGRLIPLASYFPHDPKTEAEWGFNLAEASQRGQGLDHAFTGCTLFFTPSLRKALKDSWIQLGDAAQFCGAKSMLEGMPSHVKGSKDQKSIVLGTVGGRAAKEEVRTCDQLGWTVYKHDIVTLSILRGKLDLASDEFVIRPM